MTNKSHIIKDIEAGSIAEELGLEPGDELLSINDTSIKDVLDYQYLIKDEILNVLIKKPDNEESELDIQKDYIDN